ncbi:hypothetical protein J3U66_02245 [Gilliamella sp. B2969]|uniref:hypothetical protein n=1 Tax=unclassified Gilliamella TaxID=2685620 RepID=UPI002269D6B4|nr:MULTISPECIES: hypothetical protein [unclassified Gilliamella]MCX8729196.1 hypothetical protein [Gilliamella sp. B2969]MCX8738856.1 hypothetical protein [Gilliamella sp. B2824]
MNKEWSPMFQIEIMDIIDSLQINKLRVGSPDSLIDETLGEPELPKAKLNKKFKIYNYLYGNVSILSENNIVINISIDMHGIRKKMVTLGSVNDWTLDKWLELSKLKKWNINKFCDVVNLEGKGLIISLSLEGKLTMLTLN